jgi:hypothetical protein
MPMVRAGGFPGVQRRGATHKRPASMAVALAATSVLSGVRACDFDNEIDPYTEYYNLNGDWNAFTADDCKANCCNDATCTVWQFAQYPMGHQAQCMWGDSADYGDSGGIQFQGEQGRGDDPDPSHPGGGSHKHHKCIGVHCDDGADATVFLVLFGVAAGLYTTGGLYYGIAVQKKSGLAALPNSVFWREVGGLVKDGTVFALSGGTAKAPPHGRAAYEPVPPVGQAVPVVPQVVVVAAQPAVAVAAAVSTRLVIRPRRALALLLAPLADPRALYLRVRCGVVMRVCALCGCVRGCSQPSPGKTRRVKKEKSQSKKVRVKKSRAASASPQSGSSLE